MAVIRALSLAAALLIQCTSRASSLTTGDFLSQAGPGCWVKGCVQLHHGPADVPQESTVNNSAGVLEARAAAGGLQRVQKNPEVLKKALMQRIC